MKISLSQQIEEVKRELAYRGNVYPRLVSSGKLRKGEADYHVERMQAVLKTLEWLEQNETRIKEMLAECT